LRAALLPSGPSQTAAAAVKVERLRIARVTVLALLSRAQGRHLRRDSRTVVDDLRTPESLANLTKSETFTKGHEFDAVLSKYIPQKMIGQLYPTGAVTPVPNSEIMTRSPAILQ
jgi:hypothetical protein